MDRLSRTAVLVLALEGLTFLPGCRHTAPPAAAAVASGLPDLNEATWSRIVARRSADGNRLVLRFLQRGRDAWAAADLPPSTGRPKLTALAFGKDAAAEFAALPAKQAGVPVVGRAVWDEVYARLGARLTPSAPGTATLVQAGERDLLALRRADGSATVLPLTERPPGVKIVRTVSGAGFLRELEVALAASPAGRWSRETPLLLVTGGAPEFLYVDPAAGRTAFLRVPPDLTARLPLPTLSTAHVATRGLLSLGLRSGVLPVVKNPFSSLSHGIGNGLTLVQALVAPWMHPLPGGPPPPLAPGTYMDAAAWERRLDRIAAAPPAPASLRFLVDGDAFFPRLLEGLQDARSSIDFQVYIFDNDECAVPVADALKNASLRPDVRVRVLMDEVASLQAALATRREMLPRGFHQPDSIVDFLRHDSQVRVRPMGMAGLTASHNKVIVIDHQRAWIGGMNVGREYRHDWHDLMIEIHGPLVSWIEQDFTRAWAHAGWTGDFAAGLHKFRRTRAAAARIPVPDGAIPVRPLYTTAWRHEIANAQLAALRTARNRVFVQNAYLADTEYISALIAARHRGVDVRVIFPQENDSALMQANARAVTALLIRHGIRVWELPGMSHVKAAVYDGWVCAGSANLDRLSLRVNNECSLAFSDPATVERFVHLLFVPDFARGTEIRTAPVNSWPEDLSDALLQALASQL